MSDSTFSLGSYKQVPLTVIGTDASGNVVTSAAPNPSVVSSDTTLVTVAEQVDGSFVAARVGATAGTVVITATITNADGTSATGSLTIALDAVGSGTTSANVTSVQIVAGVPA